jgi:hypothetical protein
VRLLKERILVAIGRPFHPTRGLRRKDLGLEQALAWRLRVGAARRGYLRETATARGAPRVAARDREGPPRPGDPSAAHRDFAALRE